MRIAAGACIVIGFVELWCGVARAGTYDVWGCRMPDGRAAPIAGWTTIGDGNSQSCASGGPLETQFDNAGDVGYWAVSGWRFVAPADTTIDNLTVRRAVAISDRREYHL